MAGGKVSNSLKDYHPDLLEFRSSDAPSKPSGKYLTIDEMKAQAKRRARL